MKLIIAIVKPFKLDDVRNALSDIGVQGIQLQRLRVLEDKRDIQSFIEELSMLLISYLR